MKESVWSVVEARRTEFLWVLERRTRRERGARVSGRAAGCSCLESARKAEGQSEYRGAVLSRRVEKALVWLKARVRKRARRGPERSCEKALVKVALCVKYPESHGRCTGTRGARVRDASGQAEGRREKGSRDSLFFSISFYLFHV